MYKAALLGRDISYTRSPSVHAAIARAIGEEIEFDVADVPFEELDKTAERLLNDYDGFYITKPYKNDIKKYLNSVNTACGVNYVSCEKKAGYNTDGEGFMLALDSAFCDWRKKVEGAVVLGAGGAAYSVCEALIKAGKHVYVLNRTQLNAVKLCKTLGAELYFNQPAQLIVNATTLGQYGEDAMREMCVMPEFDYAFDLIYSPPITPFLKRNAAIGAKTSNGEDMLIFQAIAGDGMLTGRTLDTAKVYKAVKNILKKEQT